MTNQPIQTSWNMVSLKDFEAASCWRRQHPMFASEMKESFDKMLKWNLMLTHWLLVIHMCISELGHHWFIYCFLPLRCQTFIETMLTYCQSDKLHLNLNSYMNFQGKFEESSFKINDCQMLAILFTPQQRKKNDVSDWKITPSCFKSCWWGTI